MNATRSGLRNAWIVTWPVSPSAAHSRTAAADSSGSRTVRDDDRFAGHDLRSARAGRTRSAGRRGRGRRRRVLGRVDQLLDDRVAVEALRRPLASASAVATAAAPRPPLPHPRLDERRERGGRRRPRTCAGPRARPRRPRRRTAACRGNVAMASRRGDEDDVASAAKRSRAAAKTGSSSSRVGTTRPIPSSRHRPSRAGTNAGRRSAERAGHRRPRRAPRRAGSRRPRGRGHRPGGPARRRNARTSSTLREALRDEDVARPSRGSHGRTSSMPSRRADARRRRIAADPGLHPARGAMAAAHLGIERELEAAAALDAPPARPPGPRRSRRP